MRLFILLLFVSNFAIAQKQRGFQVSVAYGIDRNISDFFNSLPALEKNYLNSTSVRSRHPMIFSVDYYTTRGNFRYHINGGIIRRTLQTYYIHSNESSGNYNHNTFNLGVGVSRFFKVNQKYEYEFGLDLIAGYYTHGLTIIDGASFNSFDTPSLINYVRIDFQSYGANSGEIIPMFNLYNQIAIPIASDTNLLIGAGVSGQMNKAYSFGMITYSVANGPSITSSQGYSSRDFFMWFPYLKVGIQI